MKEKTLIKIAVATNPLTWIYFALAFMCLPIDYLLKKSGLNDIWFILFKLKHLSMMELNSLHSALIRRSLKSNRTAYQKWIDRKAMNKILKHLSK